MISIIIPTYKRSSRLPIAIESVLNQTYKNIEIIVVDDNYDDTYKKETKTILAPYLADNKIIYISHNSNKGGCAARNTGAFSANGDYLAFLDDDDFYELTKLEEQVNYLNINKHLDACMCSMFRIDENNKQIESRENTARGETFKEAILDGNLFTSMLLIKKDVFLKLEGFSEIPRFQDKYFHYKFLNAGYKIGVLNKQLLTLVEHTDDRISFVNPTKAIKSIELLHHIEIKYKHLFTSKEWRIIKERYFIEKAYNFSRGSISEKAIALLNIINALPYFTNNFNIIKLFITSITPNLILKKALK